ncbi:MAG: hypothetical protein H0S85_11315 [Desulfovibrionaceae bacterium]|jgi:glycine cleavage system pyridoxal-binding protein P|nr:hypothetical protein [Desulfovibrionaceae bacterium]
MLIVACLHGIQEVNSLQLHQKFPKEKALVILRDNQGLFFWREPAGEPGADILLGEKKYAGLPDNPPSRASRPATLRELPGDSERRGEMGSEEYAFRNGAMRHFPGDALI